ncbi:MAG: DUF89 family protein [Nitrospirae bacterium]|nr:MAG: DUF89 family protein [Nitrospirota bacterium]
MNVHIDCFPCFLKQTLIAARLGTDDLQLQERIIKGVLDEIGATDMGRPPAYSTTFLHRKIRSILGKDPFKENKSEYNRKALDLYPALKEMVRDAKDPLWTASRLAIAGNIIDFGIYSSVDIEGAVQRALETPLAVDDYAELRGSLDDCDEVLYLLDNAGEIVFDRILIEQLRALGIKVRAVAKGMPVLNDATLYDAEEIGLTGVCEVIDNGSDCIGTILDMTPERFRKEFENARIIISKGQGNFETLYTTGGPASNSGKIFFLLQSKCEVVSRELGHEKGAMLLMAG